MKLPAPIVLVILDGYGLSPTTPGNPIAAAKKPVLDALMRNYPFVALHAAEQYVGLSFGEMGNSEVGHLNIGAGKVVYQNLPRITLAISEGSFFKNAVLLDAIAQAKKKNGALHCVGLYSNGGVHAHMEHLHALIKLCRDQKFFNVRIHAITDGRDTAPAVAANFIATLEEILKATKVGSIATIAGRYYAMDRNSAWDRTEKMYRAMTTGEGERATDAVAAIQASYKNNVTDEMIVPTVLCDGDAPRGLVQPNDSVIFFNFRPDRARQLTQAFVLDDFSNFNRGAKITPLAVATMMEYEAGLPAKVVFPPDFITMPLGRVVAENGWPQYRIAETEKYAHVTYFLNGGSEDAFPKEERALIPSPTVATYDKKPAMSAVGVTDTLVAAMKARKHVVYVVNYANPDMVGHTGDYDATVKAIETVDACIGRVVEAARPIGARVLITADHGNAEGLVNEVTGVIDKEHSTVPVPLFLIDEERKREKSDEEVLIMTQEYNPVGLLADIAPTILDLLGVKKPAEMTGNSLLPYLT